MKHKILSRHISSNKNQVIKVQIIAETEIEKNALQATSDMEATEEQSELVENYLLFGLKLGQYSVVDNKGRIGNEFSLVVHVG